MDNYKVTRLNIKINKLQNEIKIMKKENLKFHNRIDNIIGNIINENNELKKKCQIYGFKNERLESLLNNLIYKNSFSNNSESDYSSPHELADLNDLVIK